MISVQKLKTAITESRSIPNGINLVQRHNYTLWLKEASKNKLVKAITGFRRSGKSYLLKMLSENLSKEIPIENIFYLNFENDLLTSVKTVSDLRDVWETYLKEIADLKKPIYIIWDEIQLIKNWEKLVRALYEQGKYNIYLSGSNSQLLSGELSSALSGRSITLEILPFSFNEYLEYKKVDKANYYENKNEIDQEFTKYLVRGGLPEQFDLPPSLSQNYQDSVIQKIILDDIIRRYQIDKINVLKEIFEFICGNVTSTLSLRKIAGRLENHGLSTTVTTIDNYIHYWQTAYAVNKLTKFDYKLSRVFERTVKYYLIDNFLIKGGEENNEKRLENLVYLELVRRYGRNNLNFGQDENGYEVDFISERLGKKYFYQVAWEINEKNKKREFGNLDLIKNYQKGESKILTSENIVEWLLEK